jgi:protein gp37
MAENTKIEWAHHTFNPWIGCTKVGPGCDNCYAEADFDKRRHVVQWGAGNPRKRTAPSTWAQPIKWNAEAQRLGVRYRVFCASLADVFDNAVDREWRDDLATLILSTPNLDWLLLTKRIGNAGEMLGEMFLDGPPDNVWIGATIVNQEEADRDIPKLLAVPAAKRFLSMEPLLGPVDLGLQCENWSDDIVMDPETGAYECCKACDYTGIGNGLNWIIVGGESGPGARPMHPDWARSLRDQCEAAGVPFLFKQWGEWRPATGGELCEGHEFIKVGKKAAGRLLDGREWNGVPA